MYAENQSAVLIGGNVSTVRRVESIAVPSVLDIFRRLNTRKHELMKQIEADLSIVGFSIAPPMILAYAVSQAASAEGVVAVLNDLRNRIRQVQVMIDGLWDTSVAKRIKIANEITRELERILTNESSGLGSATTKWIVSAAPNITSGNTLSLVSSFMSGIISLDELYEQLRIRRHLSIYRRIHEQSLDLQTFFDSLIRVFGKVDFTLDELRISLIEPRYWGDTHEILRRAGLIEKIEATSISARREMTKRSAESIATYNRVYRTILKRYELHPMDWTGSPRRVILGAG
jgi:hypothetical protein